MKKTKGYCPKCQTMQLFPISGINTEECPLCLRIHAKEVKQPEKKVEQYSPNLELPFEPMEESVVVKSTGKMRIGEILDGMRANGIEKGYLSPKPEPKREETINSKDYIKIKDADAVYEEPKVPLDQTSF